MDPRIELRRMCRRHRVPHARGERLLPLVVRAASSRPEVRRTLIEIVNRELAREAALARRERREAHRDRECLVAVATVLHGWQEPD